MFNKKVRIEDDVVSLQGSLERYSQAHDAEYVFRFLLSLRTYDRDIQIFNPVKELSLSPGDFVSITPESLGVYTNMWYPATSDYVSYLPNDSLIRQGEDLWLDSFSQGISAMSIFVDEEDRSRLSELGNLMLYTVHKEDKYPAICDIYEGEYCSVATAVLENNERLNFREILAYNAGVWWVAGHIKDFRKIKVVVGGKDKVSAVDWVYDVMRSRAERSVVED